MTTQFSIDPQGGPLMLLLEFTGMMTSGYDLNLLQGEAVTPYFQYQGTSNGSSSVSIHLPGAATEHCDAVLIMSVKLSALDLANVPTYGVKWSMWQAGQSVGESRQRGDFSEDTATLDFLGLVA